jgi:hypothetical protein
MLFFPGNSFFNGSGSDRKGACPYWQERGSACRGVGANMRQREMLKIMCEARGASFYVPEKRFMGDNGSMIAYLGLLMLNSGNIISVENSHVNPNFRPDSVNVTWINPKDLEGDS